MANRGSARIRLSESMSARSLWHIAFGIYMLGVATPITAQVLYHFYG